MSLILLIFINKFITPLLIMKKAISILALIVFLTSCATPTVVNVVGPNDGAMTCNQLDTQIALANKYADDARKEKDMGTGTNVSALLFWLPGLWATHKNVEEAVDAANRRAEHLQNLKNKKNCP